MTTRRPLAVDTTMTLAIHRSQQRVRVCAAHAGLPPLLVVQHGPGFPVLHEVAKFQRRLHLEDEHLVVYWDRRGCGNVPPSDAEHVSLLQEAEDLLAVVAWLADETG